MGCGMTQKAADSAYNLFVSSIMNALDETGRASVPPLGTFTVVDRAARKGVNPKTGESIDIPARKAIKFKAGKGKDSFSG